jgi:hypothetical protein
MESAGRPLPGRVRPPLPTPSIAIMLRTMEFLAEDVAAPQARAAVNDAGLFKSVICFA